jgi:thioredoxin 1
MVDLIQATDNSFDAQVLKCDLPVLTHFVAEWSGPGQKMDSTLAEVAAEYEGRIKVVKLNIDTNPVVTSTYGVLNIPTVLLFKNGQEVERMTGNLSKADLLEQVVLYVD